MTRSNPPQPSDRAGPRASNTGYALLTLVIKPFRLEAVLGALKTFRVISVTASEVRGYGRQKGHLELYSGSEYVISFIPKIQVEVVVAWSEASELADAARLAARTGRIGDGKIFLQKLDSLQQLSSLHPPYSP